jgi:C-terminal processing protease CtpA/Prc
MKRIPRVLCALVLLLTCAAPALSQETEKSLSENRRNGLKMLKVVKDEIKKNYYDPTFHGVDLEARFKLAEEKIGQATTGGQVLGVIAQAVIDLNDSHTSFVPPLREAVAVYGWRMQMIGDACYITAVMPGSDAEEKGLRAGDRVLSLDGNEPTRETMWKMQYYYYALRPKARVEIGVQSPDGREREVEVLTKVQKRHLVAFFGWIVDADPVSPDVDDDTGHGVQYEEFGEDLIVCRLASFNITEDAVDKMMKKIAGHKALVLDLRGNPGGRVDALERFIGYFFDREVKVADLKRRKDSKQVKVKPRKSNNFAGKLVVLIDSQSSSASEIFARLMQLEKRGAVIGDRSSGSVMQSVRYYYQLGTEGKPILYGLRLTDADIIMTDGKSLEHVGVMPDELMLPTAQDLRNRRDPVLAHAAALAGVKLTPEKAGDLFILKDGMTDH